MQNKDYVIPHGCRSYSREPRPYRARPPAPRLRPPKAPADIHFLKSTMPKVSKLKPLEKYQPRALEKLKVTVSRVPRREPDRPPPRRATPPGGTVVEDVPAARANITARQQTQYEAELRRRQVEHQRQQEAIQREHARRMDLDRQRQADQQRRENQRRDRARAAENRRPAPARQADRRQEVADDNDLEALPPASRQHGGEPLSREELKAEIRRKLATELLRPKAQDENDEATPVKSNGCAGNVIVILVLGTILYFTFCSGLIDQLLN